MVLAASSAVGRDIVITETGSGTDRNPGGIDAEEAAVRISKLLCEYQ